MKCNKTWDGRKVKCRWNYNRETEKILKILTLSTTNPPLPPLKFELWTACIVSQLSWQNGSIQCNFKNVFTICTNSYKNDMSLVHRLAISNAKYLWKITFMIFRLYPYQ